MKEQEGWSSRQLALRAELLLYLASGELILLGTLRGIMLNGPIFKWVEICSDPTANQSIRRIDYVQS